MPQSTYTSEQVLAKTLDYFGQDDLAANVWMTKYALRNEEDEYIEESPDQMHWRLANEFARIEAKYPNPMTAKQIYAYFKNFEWIVPQGSPMYGIGNDFALMSLSNCVVVESPADSISGILETAKSLANLFKYRCGVGLDISPLRPENDNVNNSAKTTTGAWSFAELYSNVARMIGQNGRRAALMISMDVSHPDIEKFIEMKIDRTKVTGANISVKITHEFMQAVHADGDFELRFKGRVYKTVKARELYLKIATTARNTAEPGIIFWDNIINSIPLECYAAHGFVHIAVNPCAELALSANDSCRLMSINIASFVIDMFQKNATFAIDKFREVVRVAARLSDDLIDLEIEKLQKIIDVTDEVEVKEIFLKLQETARMGRRTGLGTHGLADLLIKLGLKYDSDQAIEFVRGVYNTFKNEAYSASAHLANERGTFPIWDWELEKDNAFINSLEPWVIEEIKKYGRRNGAQLTQAPTGSVAIVSRTSSGIEPVFRFFYTRRKKLNQNDTETPDSVDETGTGFKHYNVSHPLVAMYMKQTGEKVYSEEDLPDYFVASDKIDYIQRVRMQAAIQESIDHQISSTINLPKEATVEKVQEIYMAAHDHGLKGLTVYVDGSRSGVLLSGDEEETAFEQHSAPRRPERLQCEVHHLQAQGEKWAIIVSLMDGKPYEVFGGLANKVQIPKGFSHGEVVKHPRKTTRSYYDLELVKEPESYHIKDIVETFNNPTNLSLCRMISLSLRHGASIQYVVEQLLKEKDSDLFSFSKGVARVLKTYISNGTKTNGFCPSCGGKNLRYEDGCAACMDCGFSKC